VKRALLRLWTVESQIRAHVRAARWLSRHVPVLGGILALLMDRVLLMAYGVDVTSTSIDVAALSIGHPGGILLGGNGVVSPGRVAIMAGVKLVGRSPSDPAYVERQRERRVFVFGDNVVIGANSVVVGPVTICDNVIVGAMSLVNKDITEPGIYVGVPVRRVADTASDDWFRHLGRGAGHGVST
jgi:serine acetyltransferase